MSGVTPAASRTSGDTPTARRRVTSSARPNFAPRMSALVCSGVIGGGVGRAGSARTAGGDGSAPGRRSPPGRAAAVVRAGDVALALASRRPGRGRAFADGAGSGRGGSGGKSRSLNQARVVPIAVPPYPTAVPPYRYASSVTVVTTSATI